MFISLANLYYLNLGGDPIYAFSAIGHQWYWEYMYELSFTELWEKKKMGIEIEIREIFKEWKEFEEIRKHIALENPLTMLNFVQDKFNVEIVRAASVLAL